MSENLRAEIERVTKERDAALAACAEMRAALEHAQANVRALTGGDERRIAKALSSDAGCGWVSPEEHKRLVDAYVLLTRGLIPNGGKLP